MGKEHKEKKEKKSEKAEKKVVADAGNDSDMEVDAPPRSLDVSPIAAPLATDKLTKKLLKTVKKAAKAKHVKRGVKEVVKGLRKGEKGLVLIAGDISPIDVITHVPVLCEDNDVPYVFLPSKEDLGTAGSTKRPTSCVMVVLGGKKKDLDSAKDYKELYEECFAKVKELSLLLNPPSALYFKFEMQYERRTSQPENPFSKLVPSQTIAIIPEFTLESGHTLYQVPVAYRSWGTLNESGDNVMIICHALSGSADVEDWWGPLMGPGRAFDPTKFFIICCNVLGSPYGTASPVTLDPETKLSYGPEFPLATIRDDVRLHKLILDDLGVKSVAVCIGGSMGGMQVLEWSFLGPDYIKAIVPIATSAKHSAWCISWGEAQRQSIYSDPNYLDGYYTSDAPPTVGLSAARMAALLTYRSRNSFESRFGRKIMDKPTYSNARDPATPAEEHHQIHNDGHRNTKGILSRSSSVDSTGSLLAASSKALAAAANLSPAANGDEATSSPSSSSSTPIQAIPVVLNKNRNKSQKPTVFSAQNYLRYQGDKFISRFDANCYIAITRKMDVHDVSTGRGDLIEVLDSIKQPALVIGVESDGLFTISEQYELAEHLHDSEMVVVQSPDGHDGFLLEFEQINNAIISFMQKHQHIKDILNREGVQEVAQVGEVVKESLFGESEIVNW
ncbi:homoserine O- acetyltransferase [Entomortierella beljakovae]|nr:homoserine O- acetyltransferase [Entomortierella beljakovae]